MIIQDYDGALIDVQTEEDREAWDLIEYHDPRPCTWADAFDLYLLEEDTK